NAPTGRAGNETVAAGGSGGCRHGRSLRRRERTPADRSTDSSPGADHHRPGTNNDEYAADDRTAADYGARHDAAADHGARTHTELLQPRRRDRRHHPPGATAVSDQTRNTRCPRPRRTPRLLSLGGLSPYVA